MRIPPKDSDKITENSQNCGNSYEKTANIYRILRYILPILLVGTAILILIFHFSILNPMGFRYMEKNNRVNPYNLDSRYSDISYATGGGSAFALYRGDLALCGEGSLVLYDFTGDTLFRADTEKGKNTVLTSGRYLASYVPGMKKISLFDSFGKVHEESFSQSIACVSVSQKGNYAVIFRSASDSEICFYTDDFKKEYSVPVKNQLIMHSDISGDGKYLSTLSYRRENFEGTTELAVYSTSSSEVLFTQTFLGESPRAVGFFDKNTLYAVLDSELVFYTANGKMLQSHPLSRVKMLDADGIYLSVCQDDGVGILFSDTGKAVCNYLITPDTTHVKTKNGNCYFLSGHTVLACDKHGKTLFTAPVEPDLVNFFILEDESILLCYSSGTKRITINS